MNSLVCLPYKCSSAKTAVAVPAASKAWLNFLHWAA